MSDETDAEFLERAYRHDRWLYTVPHRTGTEEQIGTLQEIITDLLVNGRPVTIVERAGDNEEAAELIETLAPLIQQIADDERNDNEREWRNE